MDRAEAEAIYDSGREACVEFIVDLANRFARHEDRLKRLGYRLHGADDRLDDAPQVGAQAELDVRELDGGVTAEAGPPRVDEHRLAGRQREQGRLAALDVDEVDAEWSVHLRGKRGGQQKARERERREDPAHGASV